MYPSGVLVRTRLDELISSLPERLARFGPPGLKACIVEGDPDPGIKEKLELRQYSDNWCLLAVEGSEELSTLLVECLVRAEPVSELVSCRYVPEAGEYGYAFFRDGELLESFECRGPSMETINFISELRKVPLHSILRASEFMSDSMKLLGVQPESGKERKGAKTLIRVDLPGKKTFWQLLLGAVSKR